MLVSDRLGRDRLGTCGSLYDTSAWRCSSSSSSGAAASRPRIESLADLPRFSYEISVKPSDLLTAPNFVSDYGPRLRADTQALLDEPAVQAELRELTGAAFDRLLHNLNVNAGVEYYGGALAVRGNAPHHGTEEEAVVCVQPYGTLRVHAAVLSAGRIAVYTREKKYQFLPTCVKDWITLVNTGHAGRFSQPANVRLQGAN